jgi:hypothetical protein
LGVAFADKDKLADLEDAIVAAHESRKLKLPAILDVHAKGAKGKP